MPNSMDKNIERSVKRIVEYLFSDEFRHWEELGEPMNHIFIDVWSVDRWLKKMSAGRRARKRRR
jgi:hypothetical protein